MRGETPIEFSPPPQVAADFALSRLSLSSELEESLSALVARLDDFPRPLLVATEHLLLALASAEHEVAVWLRQHGIDPDSLEAEIRRRYVQGQGRVSCPPDRAEPSPRGVAADSASALPNETSLPSGTALPGVAGVERSAPPGTLWALGSPDSSHSGQMLGELGAHSQRDLVGALRVLDAAANRAREGLRVVEDYVRFVLDDAHLTGQLKRLRHDLTAALERLLLGRRLACRETQADVGTGISTAAEKRRDDPRGVLAANFTRLQESLRTLEEFGKTLDPDLATRIEQLRYRTYTLQRAVHITADSLQRLAQARLYVLIDGRGCEEEFAALARAVVEAGAHVVQLRDKTLPDRQLLQRARLLRDLTQSAGALCIMNDRPDVAVLARADGVHVGQDDLTVKDARCVVGPDALVGVSAHSLQQARQAVLDGASYLGVGPVFPSGTKHFDRFPGVELLREVAGEVRLPAFAIGGISPENVGQVRAAGFARVAVSGAVTGAADPGAVVKALLAAL